MAKRCRFFAREFTGQIGIVLNTSYFQPETDQEADIAAFKRVNQEIHDLFLSPRVNGQYPTELFEWLGVNQPVKSVGVLDFISLPMDFLGINYYSTDSVSYALDYLRAHLHMVHQAIQEGIKIKGYFAWSLLDNFEWAQGYRPRFGLVRVDFSNRQRIPKQSAIWYSQVIKENAINL